MKRLILVLALAAVAFTGVYAKSVKTDGLALGVEWGGNYGFVNGGAFGNNAAITFKLPSLPPMFGVSLALGGSYLGIGFTADWWAYRSALATGAIDVFMYVGPGLYAGLSTGNNYFNLDAGLRIPVGFQFYIIQPLELFIEPALAIGVAGIGNAGGLRIPTVGIQVQVGARFWF